MLAILTTLAIFYTLYLAAGLIVPLVMGVLVYLALSPAVGALTRVHVPRVVAAPLVLGVIFMAIGGVAWLLAAPATDWLERLPAIVQDLRWKLREVTASLAGIGDAVSAVSEIAQGGTDGATAVVVKEGGLPLGLVSGTGGFAVGLLATVVFAAFLLATEGRLGRDLVGLLPNQTQALRALRIGRQVRREISHLLLTLSLINLALGLATAAAMWLLGMPNPLLWGGLMAVLNFVPYIGPTTCMAVVALVGLSTFPTPAQALLPPLAIFALNMVESQVVTPSLLAMRLSLSPPVMLVGIALWGWIWGIAGLLLAPPLLLVMKIICDHVPALEPVGRVLGGTRRPEPSDEEAVLEPSLPGDGTPRGLLDPRPTTDSPSP